VWISLDTNIARRKTWRSKHPDEATRKGENDIVARLKFSDGWIQHWLYRFHLTRHRVTTKDKAKRPTEADLEAFFSDLRKTMQEWGLTDADLWNMDETGIWWNAGMRFILHDRDAGRAVAPASECDKKRYTGSLGASGVGLRLPLAAIVKVNAKVKHDMSASTTIKKIALQLGWRCELFECVIGGVTHKRWYAVDDETGAYVTSQTKAWMDTAGMLLYAKMIGPHIVAARREGVTRSVLVMDHHPSHDHPLVKAAFEAQGIILKGLPPNATDFLQVRCRCVCARLQSR
jgi:hypothetical protein